MKIVIKKYFFFTLILSMALGYAVQADEIKPDNDKIFVLLRQAQVMEDQLKFDSVFLFYDTATKLAMQGNDSVFLYYIRRLKGQSFINKGEIDTAKIILTEVWNYAYNKHIDTLQAQAEKNLGMIYLNERLMGYSLKYFESALSIFEKEKDTLNIAQTYIFLSNYYLDVAEYNKSLQFTLDALKLVSEKGNGKNERLYTKFLLTLGNVYEIMGKYDSAESCYRTVYDYGIKEKNMLFANRSLSNIALIFYRQGNDEYNKGNTEKAKEYFDKSTELYMKSIENIEQVNDKNELSLYYGALGPIYRKLGEYDKARECYEIALGYAKEAGKVGGQIAILKNMGMLYRTEGNYQAAKKYMLESLQLAEEFNDKAGQRDAYNSLAVLYEMMGDYKESNSYLNKYFGLYKSIVSDEKIKASNEMLFAFEREKDKERIKDLLTQKTINELEKKSIRAERNASIGISVTIVFLLILILFYFRMKSRKNRIIDAQRIQQLEDEKKLLAAQSVIVGQENERKRIAQELHDGIGVLLSTASIHFSVVSKTSKDKKTVEMLDKAEKLLKQAGGEVRKISQNMMPVVLSKFGLIEALEDIFEKLDEIDDLSVSANFSGSNGRLPENTEIMLFRIVQEMVNNTLKHAQAKNIEFSFSKGNGVILIDYKDDGVGFELDKLPRNSSLGVYGIQSRIDFLNGKLKVESKIGQGVYYHVSIPINGTKS